MEFTPEGNLGKIDLLERHLLSKNMKSRAVTLSQEELHEIEDQLRQFRHVLSNMFLHENQLKNEGYGGLTRTLNELEPYYRNYDGE